MGVVGRRGETSYSLGFVGALYRYQHERLLFVFLCCPACLFSRHYNTTNTNPTRGYFDYIRKEHGHHVLACVVFFCLGHHNVCKGGW